MFKADYTRKTQSLAEERKALERSAAETAQLREQLSESLKRWAVPTEAEPDWAELATKLPPQEYNLRRVQWEQRQRQKEQARAEFHAMQDQLRAEAIATERNKLLEAFPEWRDEAKFLNAAKQMADGATVYGFSAEEVGQIADHRIGFEQIPQPEREQADGGRQVEHREPPPGRRREFRVSGGEGHGSRHDVRPVGE